MFKKSAVPKTIHVALAFTTEFEDAETGDVYEDESVVVHHFNRPKPSVRERLAERIGAGGRIKSGRIIKETYLFWKNHVIDVEGYEELLDKKTGKTAPMGGDYWNNYFGDAVGLEHVQAAVFALLNKMGGQETDYIKKSDSSQEE